MVYEWVGSGFRYNSGETNSREGLYGLIWSGEWRYKDCKKFKSVGSLFGSSGRMGRMVVGVVQNCKQLQLQLQESVQQVVELELSSRCSRQEK